MTPKARLVTLAVCLAAGSAIADAQCYQFAGSGVTLQVNISSISFQSGPAVSQFGATTIYGFYGTNSFTSGGVALASSDTPLNGLSATANIQYTTPLAGNSGSTVFQIVVPNADTDRTQGNHDWEVDLEGVGNLIPSFVFPQTLPPISAWTGFGSSGNLIHVYSGASTTQYAVTSISACGSGPSVPGQTLGDPSTLPGSCPCGLPISAGTGNMFEHADDYHTSGANQLGFTRYYNSMAGSPTFAVSVGANWRSNYDRYLDISSTSVVAERPDGQRVTFTSSGGAWTTDTDIDLTLTNSGSTWTLTDHHDSVETYSTLSASEGLLETIQARNGYTQTLQYNSNNQLGSVTDSYNRQLSFIYAGALLQKINTPDGLVVGYSYTGGNLTGVAYTTTPATTLTYLYETTALPNALTGIIDENGNRYATWTYDSTGRALSSQHASGADLTTVAYNDSDGSRTVTNALGQQELDKFTTLQGVPKLTESDRVATATTAAGTSTYSYDSNGYLASYSDWNGDVTTYVNDSRGQPSTISQAVGTTLIRTTTITYHPKFRLPVQIVTPGLTTSLAYDSVGELLTTTLADTTSATSPYSTNGQTRTWTYTYSNFLVTSVKSPRTDVSGLTKFAYDTSGALTSVTNALNQVVNVNKHLPGGLPQTIVNANGVTTNLTYDARQRLLSTAMATSAGVLTTSYSYDGAGNLVTVTQPDGSSITNSYDASHRLIGVADKLGNRVAYALDAFGDRIQTTVLDPSANSRLTRSGTFDALGRLVQAIGGVNQVTTFSYDSDGNRLTVTDPLSHTTQQSFDALNRPIKGTNAANGITSMGYDSHDRITSVVDPNSASTSYIYDGFGEAIQQVSPTAGTMVYHYDSGGNLSQTVDGRGVVANYTYDALDREVSVIYPGNSAENVAYTYDQANHGFGVGRLTSIADAAGALSRAYDERGNLLSEMRTSGAATLATTYSYDAASRAASITYPSQWSVTYTRDTMGRITAVNAQAPGGKATQSIVSAVGYQPFGAVNALTYGNGIAETRSFDLDYRLKSITDIVQKLTYNYDAAGNVLGVSDGLNPPNNQIAGYDALNRLTSASGSYGGLNYSYDANGNRLSDTSSTTSDGLGSVTSLTYNQGGRLATASNAQQQLTEYSYDAFGHRLVKVGAVTATTIYQYSRGGQLLEEADGQGHPQVDYVYMDSRPIATIQASNNQVYFLHSDRLDAPQMATDGAQAIAWSTSYQPFGQISSAPTAITEDLRLPGQESDIETGLYHNGFRDYVPGWGRYQASDPIGLAGGLNGYAYVGSNPIRYADPFGLCPPPDVSAPGPTPSADPTKSALLAQLQSLNPGDWGQFALGTWDSAVSTLADSLNEVGEGLAGDALAAAQDLANLQKLALGAAGVVLNGLAIAVDVGQSLSGQKLATLAADLIAGGVAIGVGVLLAPAVAVGGATAVVIGTGVAVIGAAVNWAIGAGVKNILLGGNRATLY